MIDNKISEMEAPLSCSMRFMCMTWSLTSVMESSHLDPDPDHIFLKFVADSRHRHTSSIPKYPGPSSSS
jgi:hypothetical protein